MTAFHRAARTGDSSLVMRFCAELPEGADFRTFPSRAPGLYTPLMCLADGDGRVLDPTTTKETIDVLIENMSWEAFVTQSSVKKSTWAHLAAGRNNAWIAEHVCEKACAKWRPQDLRGLLPSFFCFFNGLWPGKLMVYIK